jgi:hypothetical protein
MKQIFIDVVGTSGIGFLVYGIYLKHGISYAFIALGLMLVTWSLIKSRAVK